MKPPRQKTVDARYRDDNNFNSQKRPTKNDAKLINNNLQESSSSQATKHYLNLPDKRPAPLSRPDSEDDSDAPLIKRRRATANQSTMERNATIPPKKPTMSEHDVIDLTIDDDDPAITGNAKLPQATRKLTPGVSERFESTVSSTQIDVPPRPIFAMAFLDIAQKRLLKYAGPHTQELEARYFQWQENGKPHDKICLVCCSANTNLACNTCKRVYHVCCLKPAQTLGQAGGSFSCPLCTKRTWSEEAPSRDLDPERRLLALASQLRYIGAMAAWMNMRDTGEALDDQKLLYDMDVTATDVAENTPEGIDPDTASEAIMLDVPPEVKHEHIKEEDVQVQSSDKQPENIPLGHEDQLQYIRCVCGDCQLSDDIERTMYGCDGCLAWQHADCMGLSTGYDHDQYFCERCRPQDHEKLLSATYRGEKPWEHLKRRTSDSVREASIDLGTDADLSTLPVSQPSRQISPLIHEIGNTLASRKLAQTQHRKTRKSEAQPGQEHGAAKRTKRNLVRSNSNGMLRGEDAMKALQKADSAAKRDLYLYNKGWNHAQEPPESSATQTMLMAERFASRGVSLTFAPEISSNEDLSAKRLENTLGSGQSNTRITQDQRAFREISPSQEGRASPEIGTPGHTNDDAAIPESPPGLATESYTASVWQFYEPKNPAPSANQSGPDQSLADPILSRPKLDTSKTGSFQRPLRALESWEAHQPIILGRPNTLQPSLGHPYFAAAYPPKPHRTSTYDLPGPPQDVNTQAPLTSTVAASVLGSQVTLPVIQGLAQHPHASNRQFWQAVQIILHRIPDTKTDGILLRQRLDERLPELFEGSFTTTQDLLGPATSSQQQQPVEAADTTMLAGAVLEHDSNLERVPIVAPNTISQPSSDIPASRAPSSQAIAARLTQSTLPPLSGSTTRLISSTALGRKLATQPAIAALLNEHSPLTEMTIGVIKGLEQQKILAYEYKFLMEQLADALPWEWPKKDKQADMHGYADAAR